jgi:hypothetical protein
MPKKVSIKKEINEDGECLSCGRGKCVDKEVEEKLITSHETKKEVKKIRKPRAPSAYNLFVKEHMMKDEIKSLPPKMRFTKISELYKKEKGETKSSA